MLQITRMLALGADPLLECNNNDKTYKNIFQFTKENMDEIEASRVALAAKVDSKGKTSPVSKMDPKLPNPEDYEQATDLMIECARMLHIRWLQAKLMKDLIQVVDRFKHRHWNIILKEHKQKKATRLWLTSQRCLEIWHILKSTHRKIYAEHRVLRHVLAIVHYYNQKSRYDDVYGPNLTAVIKSLIDTDVQNILREENNLKSVDKEIDIFKKPYVKPELVIKGEKFNICFECCLPLEDTSIVCKSCKLVSFCSLNCIKKNIEKVDVHPCRNYLKKKYFSSPLESFTNLAT